MASIPCKTSCVPSDGITFLSNGVVPEVEMMSKYLRELDKEQYRAILRCVVNAIAGENSCESLQTIAESVVVTEEKLSHIVAGMLGLLKEALRLPKSSLKQEVFQEDLRAFRLSEECIADFSRVVFGNKRESLEDVSQQVTQSPTIREFSWRVDVAISTSAVARSLQPSLLVQIKRSDETAYQFEVPASKFQELRYTVALILKEMNDLEKRNILKIQD